MRMREDGRRASGAGRGRGGCNTPRGTFFRIKPSCAVRLEEAEAAYFRFEAILSGREQG